MEINTFKNIDIDYVYRDNKYCYINISNRYFSYHINRKKYFLYHSFDITYNSNHIDLELMFLLNADTVFEKYYSKKNYLQYSPLLYVKKNFAEKYHNFISDLNKMLVKYKYDIDFKEKLNEFFDFLAKKTFVFKNPNKFKTSFVFENNNFYCSNFRVYKTTQVYYKHKKQNFYVLILDRYNCYIITDFRGLKSIIKSISKKLFKKENFKNFYQSLNYFFHNLEWFDKRKKFTYLDYIKNRINIADLVIFNFLTLFNPKPKSIDDFIFYLKKLHVYAKLLK